MRESLYRRVRVRPSLPFGTVGGDGTTSGTAVDLNYNKQQFRTAMLVVVSGEVTDGTYTFSVQESANGTTGWTDIPAERIEGTLVDIEADDNDLAHEYGVLLDPGNKPFIRASVLADGVTDGGVVGAIFVLATPNNTPVVRT